MSVARYLTSNVYIKWVLIVGLNAVLGFILGHEAENSLHLFGMISGVVTWFFAYLFLDKYLQKTGRMNMSRKLSLSAAFRIPLQFLFLPDVYAGLAAVVTVDFIGIYELGNDLIEAYFTTVLTGLYLSLMCALIYPIITQIDAIRSRRADV